MAEEDKEFETDASVLAQAAHKLKGVLGAAGMSAVLAEAISSSSLFARALGVSAAFSEGLAYIIGGLFFLCSILLETYLEKRSRQRDKIDAAADHAGARRGSY